MKKSSHRATRIQTLALHRKVKPAKGMGRVQRSCRRALIANNGVVSTADCITWAYSQKLLIGGERTNDMNGTVRNALEAIGARRIERLKTGKGTAWLWASADAHVSE